MATCPLCEKKVEKLHKKSHLLPNSLCKNIYNDRHKAIKIEDEKPSKVQNTFYDKIICRPCEEYSQKFDHYANHVLRNDSQESNKYSKICRENYKTDSNISYSIWKNIDFHKFQKFVFICILRTHFWELKRKNKPLLMDGDFNSIRNIYLSDELIDEESYPITMLRLLDRDGTEKLVVLPYYFNEKKGEPLIEFLLEGYIFTVYVSSHKKPNFADKLTIKKNGELYVFNTWLKETGIGKNAIDMTKESHKKSNFRYK